MTGTAIVTRDLVKRRGRHRALDGFTLVVPRGSVMGLVGANGRSLWTSWLAGLDPSAEESTEFTVSIDVSGGVPRLSWSPDLGDARAYTVWGRETLDAADPWAQVDIDDVGTSQFRFFKVSVGMPVEE